ncbi:hypothetical protein AYO40_02305 [Planctomycetaceae bacterium SCGC AG-212-D15]|nr:hypothetical protein AYO40_02305 [Planctomycetaceae bacterium SCGC AG-212-D15]
MLSHSRDTLALTVDNTGFLLDRLGADCHPLQFLRELTQNSIEAILRTPQQRGDILWDVDWTQYELSKHKTYKLSITDNGCGMTGEEMVRYINQLSSSAATQSVEGNYGVGAKIAAATRNHAGLIYLSWKHSDGCMIHLWRDPKTAVYGLRQVKKPDGSFGHYAKIKNDVKPEIIKAHGTKLVLLGMSDDADTMVAPGDTQSPSRWIAKYLNSRYFRFPSGITVKAREGWEHPRTDNDLNVLRTITGQEHYLNAHQQARGTAKLDGARVHWWILKDEPALGSNSGYMESAGHVAALYQDELYELANGRSGYTRLQQFGVIFGQRQVVLYLEPLFDATRRITTNTARTSLLISGESLPWSDWAAEFRDNLPEPLKEFMEDIAAKSTGTDHAQTIRDHLKPILTLYNVSRYRPTPKGSLRIADPTPDTGGTAVLVKGEHTVSGGGGPRVVSVLPVGGAYSAFLKKDGSSGDKVRPDLFPSVKWVSLEKGTRVPGELEDKAARYVPEQHLVKINSDFRVFVDMTQHWLEVYKQEHGDHPGLREIIEDSVHKWYEQALVETVIGVQALKGSREWSIKHIQDALSEESLTAVVMQRYHAYNAVRRDLAAKIAPVRK